MKQESLRRTIENILDHDDVGVMATVRKNKPFSRYMTFFHESLKLYTVTSKDTHKIAELESNPYTHILLGYEGDGFGDEYVEYQGKATITDSEELKDKLWNAHMQLWFNGPNDPNFIVLQITPIQISLLNKKGAAPQVLDI